MSKAAFTVLVHGIFASLSGLGLLLVPGPILALLGFETTPNLWVRVFGLEVSVLGFYYLISVSRELTPIFRASIIGRLFFAAVLVIMVLLGEAGWNLVLLGVVDVAGSLWTLAILRRSHSAAATPGGS